LNIKRHEFLIASGNKYLVHIKHLHTALYCMYLLCPRPLIGGALSDAFVWRLLHTSGLSREQRGLGRLKSVKR